SADTVDSRIWPRMAAIAERFWSPRDVTNEDSMYARLESVSRLLTWNGVDHRNDRALDRINPSEAMRVLAQASEALGINTRQKGHKYTSEIPLNRFVDAIPPESENVRHLEQDVRRLAAGGDDLQLRSTFDRWAQNDTLLHPDGELAEISKNLSRLG